MPGERARQALAGTRFTDVRWVAETGSTNADALALVADGAPEGIVLVADHQRAGRGRQGRTWMAPAGSSLLISVLLRPPAAVLDATTMATAVAAAEALERVAGFSPGLKWPNDLVVPGRGDGAGAGGGGDRKLAGLLAEVDWPAASNIAAGWRPPGPGERVGVVVGIGINVNWPADLPAELADLAVAANHVAGHELDREELLIELLGRLDVHYGTLLGDGGRDEVFAEWRARSATLGRRVRVALGGQDVVGTAVDVTPEGHLVVATDAGERRSFAVADVVHLRPLD